MKKINIFVMSLILLLSLSMQVHATLSTIGTATYNLSNYNLIYDDDLGITWMDYSNPINNWQNQVNWAAGLNTAGVLTYNLNPGVTMSWSGDWRLPTTLQPDPSCSTQYNPGGGFPIQGYGYNCTGSEMGHLSYTETNKGDFTYLAPYYYWSGTQYTPYAGYAWYFSFYSSNQNVNPKNVNMLAMAVRPGTLSTSAPSTSVPEPATLLLLGFGLAGIAVWRKRLGRNEC